MSHLTHGLNTLWMLSCQRERSSFEKATRKVASTQWDVLSRILECNRASDFGRIHGFSQVRSPQEFQQRVPVRCYEDYSGDIERISNGEPNVLTCEPVRIFEPTSGTTSGEKLIPYTASLRRQFQRMISTWIGDLFLRRPAVRKGRAYWSISPAFGPRRKTSAGIPIGFDDDIEYLGWFERQFAARLMAVPGDVAKIPNIEQFRYETLFRLLLAEDLSLISVWNPTFITRLLDSIETHCERLCGDLRASGLERGRSVELILQRNESLAAKLRLIWKDLALISCWTDAAAAHGLDDLARLLPDVEVQSKGLLATEAAVSFPLVDRPGAALAIRSHFLEFRQTGTSELRLAHELEEGEQYEVVVTTGGGLYRYELKDLLEVTAFENECPLVRFVGKSNRVSDLVGEKLGEPHVAEVLRNAFASVELGSPRAMLVPSTGNPPHYRLVLRHGSLTTERAEALRRRVNDGLEENPYYHHAVGIGQLGPFELHVLAEGAESPWQVYERECLAVGQKAGDIKPTVLGVGVTWDPTVPV